MGSQKGMKHPLRVAMVAYANYFTDARIKNYVDALLDAGASVDVFALGKEVGSYSDGNLFVNNVRTKYWGSSALGYIVGQLSFLVQATWRLLMRSFAGRYDIIHAHNMPNILALTGLPFKVLGTKVILDVHDTMPEAYATKFGYSLDSLATRILVGEEVLSAACADKVITTNIMHKEVLIGHGIPANKIAQILNVGNRKIFKPRPYRAHGHELWLGYHGTIARRLGVFLIVDALSFIKEACPGVRFLCVGEGDDLAAMKQRAEEKRVTDMVEWKPFVAVEKLPEVLNKVDVGVIGNQRDTELKRNYMLPVKMLEYAAMEIPTVGPRLQILERYFNDTSAFFYEPDDASALANAIRAIYNNRSLITARIDGLRKFNAEYNWDIMAERYLTMINEVVS
ncbi:MAG: glycosyltransferase [Pseudomonadota bacterium]|nr:glycosyltransferase [Pseudomonadota bacterium]